MSPRSTKPASRRRSWQGKKSGASRTTRAIFASMDSGSRPSVFAVHAAAFPAAASRAAVSMIARLVASLALVPSEVS